MSLFNRVTLAAVAISGLSLATQPELALAGPYEDQVALQLVSLGHGVYPSESFIGKISNGQSKVLRVVLDANRDYQILGVCDEDCADMDLALYDENGNQVDHDEEYDDFPLVVITPAWTGPFYLEITVPSCQAWRCTVGVGVY